MCPNFFHAKLETLWVGASHVSFCASAKLNPEAEVKLGKGEEGPVPHNF